MKKGVLIAFLVVFLISFGIVNSAPDVPPAFEVFTGYVYCSGSTDPISSYVIDAVAYNDTESNSYSDSVSSELYSFVIDSYLGYNVSLSIGGVTLGDYEYIPYSYVENNFTLASDNSLCTSPETPSGGGGGGGSSKRCGDSIINLEKEQCDKTDLGGKTCAILGYTSGTLSCKSDCTFDTSSCVGATTSVCGNGVVDSGEECDGSLLNGQTCGGLGYDSGTLSCKSDCTFDESSCNKGLGFRMPTEPSQTLLFWVIGILFVIFLVVIGVLIYLKMKDKNRKGIQLN